MTKFSVQNWYNTVNQKFCLVCIDSEISVGYNSANNANPQIFSANIFRIVIEQECRERTREGEMKDVALAEDIFFIPSTYQVVHSHL